MQKHLWYFHYLLEKLLLNNITQQEKKLFQMFKKNLIETFKPKIKAFISFLYTCVCIQVIFENVFLNFLILFLL